MAEPRRTALITGGSRGIGRAIAEALACTHDLVIGYRSQRDAAEAAASALRERGAEVLVHPCDIKDVASLARLAGAALARFGRVDTLVTNAATGLHRPISVSDWAQVATSVQVIAGSFVELVSRLAPAMAAGGRIIAISGLDTRFAVADHGLTGAGKAAVENLVRSLASELGPREITVNAVIPGPTRTESLRRAMERKPGSEQKLIDCIPAGRLAEPDDIAGVVAFLASPAAAYVNGTAILVDGGFSAGEFLDRTPNEISPARRLAGDATGRMTQTIMAIFDLVIRGGTIVDGSGGAPYVGDIGVTAGRIAEIGKIATSGREEIDAEGHLVTPGFVDIHTHYDGQVTWEHTLAPSSGHGVTTVVMGNCGVGFAPCRAEDRKTLIRVMEGVEDIPGIVMDQGVPWNWESFPEYLDALDARSYDIDVAAQLPHSPIRVFVMGTRGADREAATAAELGEMRALVAEGVRAGALGVTTSRVTTHRTRAGELAPSVTADEQELHALAKGLADAGAGVLQLVPESAIDSAEPADDVAMFERLATTAGRPLSFTLIDREPKRTAELLRLVGDANRGGLAIKAQVYPRPIGILFGLELSLHPFRFRPSYQAIEDLPLAARVAAMRDPAVRARLLAEKNEHSNPIFTTLTSFVDDLTPLGDPPNYEPSETDNVAARAARRGVSPIEACYDLLLEQEGHMTLLLPKSNYVGHSLAHLADLLTEKDVILGLGDGGAHYGMICDASYPTFLLTYWTRDRISGPKLPLPWVIKALSRDTAQAVGLDDRGLLRPGYKADINVIDYAGVTLGAPFGVRDLPAGGRRLYQLAKGYAATIVGGVVTYRDGTATGALPGRLVRGAQAEPVWRQ